MDPKKLVADGYDQMHHIYAAWTASADGPRRRYIDRVVDLGLSSPATVLDLGCGTGRHATSYLVELGFDVTGIDISPASIATARQEVPGAGFEVADMATVELPADSFDPVTAFYSIIHVPRHEHSAVLSRIASWLRPGGYLLVNLAGAVERWSGIDESWLATAPMYWSHWDAPTSRSLVVAAGLDVVVDDIETTLEDDREVSFLWMIARKPTTR